MIRFAVLLFFFVHLWVLIKAPQFKRAAQIVGFGIPAAFFGLYLFGVEENSDIVFIVLGVLSLIAAIVAELLAAIFVRKTD